MDEFEPASPWDAKSVAGKAMQLKVLTLEATMDD